MNNTMAEQRTLDAEREFEAWWESDGQYIRAGGGQYEKSFAYAAWLAARRAPPALDAVGLPAPVLPPWPEPVCGTEHEKAIYAPWLTDKDIVDALHSLGIDTEMSKYGFAAIQVRGTNVPGIRRLVDKLARQSAPEGAPVVKIQHGRVWIVRGNQSFMLAYEADDDEPENVEWYASKLRSAIGCFTPGVKVEGAPVGMEAVAWLEAEASARGQSARAVLNSFCYSTRMHTKTAPVTSNPVWALYAPTSASAQPPEGVEHASHNKENSDE